MMGAADAVPGVSGGTIAFITGIYEELIGSISRFDLSALKSLREHGLAKTWATVNGSFLTVLVAGILSSIIVLSNIILYMLDTHPQALWGFFFGLIAASTVVMFKAIKQWSVISVVAFSLAAITSFFLTTLSASVLEANLVNIFFAGMLAICAMILPGISGSFILLLLGLYSSVLGAVKNLELMVISVFALGCISGLLCFSNILTWLFKHYRDLTMALLTGFLVGSLNKVWPWKEVLTTRINSKGLEVADSQRNILPNSFESLTGLDAQLLTVVSLSVAGIVLVLLIEKINRIE
jgi:putative membrane protein